MKVQELLQRYAQTRQAERLQAALTDAKQKRIKTTGLVGSSFAVFAAAFVQKVGGSHLFVLPDKEQASYFFGDMERLFEEQEHDYLDRKVLYFSAQVQKGNKIDQYNNQLRIKVFERIRSEENVILVSYPQALLEKVTDSRNLENIVLTLSKDELYSIDNLIEDISKMDFQYCDYVVEPGTFSIRGGLVDVFSYANELPARIEFVGDKIHSIRLFNVETQLTEKTLETTNIVSNYQQNLEGRQCVDFLTLLNPQTTLWLDDMELCQQEIKKFFQTLSTQQEEHPPYTSMESYQRSLLDFNLIEFGKTSYAQPNLSLDFNTEPQLSYNKQFDLLLDQWLAYYTNDYTTIFSSANENQSLRVRNIVRDLFDNNEKYSFLTQKEKQEYEKNLVSYVPYTLHEGFVDHDLKIAFFTDHQVFNRYHRYRIEDSYKKSESITMKELYELQPGDYVTHIDHGVGQYAGLEKIAIKGKQQEAIKIIYKGNDVLYISIHSLHRIAKYCGKDGMEPTLNRLGSNTWNRLKEKTKNRVKELVIDLAKLYAERKATQGFSFSADNYMQSELEASFVYEDTPDQIKATKEVKQDMEADYPMDRLICGDVGFGKTEIAIRAAFKAVCDSKQVAILVPTTVLALQHYHTFRDRLAQLPCSVDYINRFKTAKQQKETLQKLKNGQLDIIIGTHRLLGKDVVFKDLGLLIIDEEQKFGVGAKEKLRSLKVNVDTLTMTATPIPRTLQFSLMGARDISIMRTPPLNRYPIETEVCMYSEDVLFSAVEYELYRGGQVFVVNNRINTLSEIAGVIQNHFPNKKVIIAHGQMDGEQLERIMIDFIDGNYDVLVSTTIVESGLDIPNANTIIINDAQNFGLSELHQLRGRVGRKNKKAFCYLFTPPRDVLSDTSRKRLDAIEQFSDIGSGFNIAMRDLDIRGAGNILGAEQSGFITEIGYEMYQKILEEALEELREKDMKEGQISVSEDYCFVNDCVIETDMELLIPDTYVQSNTERFSLYKELNTFSNQEQLIDFSNRLIDRFGDIPPQTTQLIDSMLLRNRAKKVGFEKLILKQGKMIAHFISKQGSPYYDSLQFQYILSFLQNNQQQCTMREAKDKLTLTFERVLSIEKAMNIIAKLQLPLRVN